MYNLISGWECLNITTAKKKNLNMPKKQPTYYFGWSWSWPEVYELKEGLHSSQPEEGPALCPWLLSSFQKSVIIWIHNVMILSVHSTLDLAFGWPYHFLFCFYTYGLNI